MSDTGLISSLLKTALPDPTEADNVVYDPSPERLRAFSQGLETATEFGSLAYVSEQRSRCADRTKNALDDEFDAADHAHVETALEYARENEMVCLDRKIGRHPDHTYVGRYYVPKRDARIALTVTKLFEPAERGADPDFLTVQVPDHDEIAIRVLPESGVTIDPVRSGGLSLAGFMSADGTTLESDMSNSETTPYGNETLRPPCDETKKETRDPRAELNQLGVAGWEFAETVDNGVATIKCLVFKRPARSSQPA